ncbi:MAG TPA: PKD domain-containing protein [Thermoflexales bacterium]|nr:PKD domain-containing protein [Thermoflexales bacterium]
MIKRISVLLLSLALALPAAIPLPAAAPAIGPTRPAGTASGVAWLLARQDAGGGWTNVAGLTARDTAVVVEALAALGQTGGLERGAAWLAGREPAPTDLLARAVRALQAAGRADADLEAALAARQRNDWGWGFAAASFSSAAFDSALAMLALRASPAYSPTRASQGIQYLLGKQGANGGWSLTPGITSTFATAHGLLALDAWRDRYNLATPIGRAAALLQAKQKGDGSYGDSASGTVEETALAHLGLWSSGAVTPTALANARAWLAGAQLGNGSWNNSVYATALALQALAQPDNARIIGRVVVEGGAIGIAGATVAAGAVSTSTNASGYFTLTGVFPGAVTLDVSKSGFNTSQLPLTAPTRGTLNAGVIPLRGSAPSVLFTWAPDPATEADTIVFADASVAQPGTSIVEYTWMASNGAFAQSASPSFAVIPPDSGPLSVTLQVRDNLNRYSTLEQAVDVLNTPPQVAASGPISELVGMTLTLEATMTDSGRIDVTRLVGVWDLGDGLVYTGARVSRPYSSIGTYTATFTAWDRDGDSASAEVVFDIVPDGAITQTPPITEIVPPVPSLTFTLRTNGLACPTLPPREGDRCIFDPLASFSNDGTPFAGIAWTFGDGTPEEPVAGLISRTHRYAQNGEYEVSAFGQVESGLYAILTQTVTVVNVPPVVSLDGGGAEDAGNPVALHASAFDPGDAAALAYRWWFGDGTSAAPTNITLNGATASVLGEHRWLSGGVFTATLVVTDTDGAVGMASTVFTITNNRAPLITSEPPLVAVVGLTYTYAIAATEPDSDTIAWLLSAPPAGMSIDASGVITWVPALDQIGQELVVVIAGDGTGHLTQQTWWVTINPPVVNPPGVGGLFPPDLVPVSVDARDARVSAESNLVSGLVTVTTQNLGLGGSFGAFTVTVFDDVDGDTIRTPGVDIDLGAARVAITLAPAALVAAGIPVSGVAQLRDATLSAMVDSANEIGESALGEMNNVRASAYTLRYVPPPGVFAPYLKWAWRGAAGMDDGDGAWVNNIAAVAPFIDTTGDGIIDAADTPAIVFEASEFLAPPDALARAARRAGLDCDPKLEQKCDVAPQALNAPGVGSRNDVIRVLRGDTGVEICNVALPFGTFNEGVNHTAVGDLDGDGRPEIAIVDASSRPRAFNNDCSTKWIGQSPTSTVGTGYAGAPTLADLDADGKVEVIYSNAAWNFDGSLRWMGAGPTSYSRYCCFATVADLDGDGAPEVIVNGQTAYRADGSLYWQRADLPVGYVAVANLDPEPEPEIINVAADWEGVRALESDGSPKWGPVALPQGGGGPPAVTDLNRDGVPDIAVAGYRRLVALNGANGAILWSRAIRDNSYAGGVAAFDFDGDGIPELAYRDEFDLFLFRGSDGAVLWQIPNPSATAAEYPVIADVDNDGHADLIVSRDQYWGAGEAVGVNDSGIFVYADALNNWRPARGVWNQHDYHFNNVDNDGRVPARESSSWTRHNTFRAQHGPDGLDPFAAPDLVALRLEVDTNGCPTGLGLTLRVRNAGNAVVPRNVAIGFYDGAIAPANRIATASLGDLLPAGETREVAATWLNPPAGQTRSIIAFVDDPSAGFIVVPEAREDNNTITRTLEICGPNTPPVFVSLPVTTAVAGLAYAYDANATDADGDTLAYSLGLSPPGMAIVATTGVIVWLPGQAGDYAVIASVSDGQGGSAAQSYTVTVFAPEPPPPPPICDIPGGDPAAAEIPGNGIDDDCNPGTPDTIPPGAVSAAISTDMQVYAPRDVASLFPVVTHFSGAGSYAGLTATLMVRNPGNTVVYLAARPVPALAPGATYADSDLFDIANGAPGTYTADLLVYAGGAQVAAAATSFQVATSAGAGIALAGTLLPAPPAGPSGAPFSVIWSATNVGNAAVNGAGLQIVVVDPVSHVILAQAATTQTLALSQTVGATTPFAGLNYSGTLVLALVAYTGPTSQTLAIGTLTLGAGGVAYLPVVVR